MLAEQTLSKNAPRSSDAPSPLRAAATRIVSTDGGWGATVARWTLGAVILPHGLQKTVGAFGGYGFDGTMAFFTETMGLPTVIAVAVIAIESLGALLLLAGAGGRLAAGGIAAVMTGAVLTTHLQHGFFMNWFGTQDGEGYEYHLLAIGLALVVMIAGAGKASVDRLLTARLRGQGGGEGARAAR